MSVSADAARLREDFDRSFAEPLALPGGPTEDFLALRVGGDAYVLHLSEVASLQPLRAVTQLPSPARALLGIVAFRGAIVPLYDLGLLLGGTSTEAARWIVIATEGPVAFAFDTFEGHRRDAREACAQPSGGEPARPHVSAVLLSAGELRPVLSLASLIASIRNDPASKEP